MMPLTDPEIRRFGYEPTRRGWKPLTPERAARDAAIVEGRRVQQPGTSLALPDGTVPCFVCERVAERSLVETPTCSGLCTSILAAWTFDLIADDLRTKVAPDGTITGGSPSVSPPPRRGPSRRRVRDGVASVERARERTGDCRTVLERHGVPMRGQRMAFCPLHPNTRTPAMSLFESGGVSRFHCHGCGASGDAIDLEAYMAAESVGDTIRRWGR